MEMSDEKTPVMNDDDTPSILQRQMALKTEPVISPQAIRCHGLVNSLCESHGVLSLEIHLCEQCVRNMLQNTVQCNGEIVVMLWCFIRNLEDL